MKTLSKSNAGKKMRSKVPVVEFEILLGVIEAEKNRRVASILSQQMNSRSSSMKITIGKKSKIKPNSKLKSNRKNLISIPKSEIKEAMVKKMLEWGIPTNPVSFEVKVKLPIFKDESKRFHKDCGDWDTEKIFEEMKNLALKKKDLICFAGKNFLYLDPGDIYKNK